MNDMNGKRASMVFQQHKLLQKYGTGKKNKYKDKNSVDDWRYTAFHKNIEKEMEFNPKN